MSLSGIPSDRTSAADKVLDAWCRTNPQSRLSEITYQTFVLEDFNLYLSYLSDSKNMDIEQLSPWVLDQLYLKEHTDQMTILTANTMVAMAVTYNNAVANNVDDTINGLKQGTDEVTDFVTTPDGRTISKSVYDEMIITEGNWNSGTFKTLTDSQSYHYAKHGVSAGKTFTEYTDDAINFFNKYNQSDYSISHTLSNGLKGYKIKVPNVGGGYFTETGEIITFWY